MSLNTKSWMIVGIVAVFLLITALSCAEHADRESLSVRVTGKERVVEGTGDNVRSKYLIFTSEETFEVTDSVLEGRWDSSDLYGHLEEEKCYDLEVYGWRIPVVSSYRNIVSATETPCL